MQKGSTLKVMEEFNIQGKQTSFYKYFPGTFGYTTVYWNLRSLLYSVWHKLWHTTFQVVKFFICSFGNNFSCNVLASFKWHEFFFNSMCLSTHIRKLRFILTYHKLQTVPRSKYSDTNTRKKTGTLMLLKVGLFCLCDECVYCTWRIFLS